jgi:hypothetical protein
VHPSSAERLPVKAAAEIAVDEQPSAWLIEDLWTAGGVGVIGGAPKSCKTWLALELAVSVACGTAALGRFPVADPGPVLYYGAEDAPAQLRARIEMLAGSRRIEIAKLALGLILVPTLRLDTDRDRQRLAATIEHHQPRFLVLDPLVRLHRIDENSAGDMSSLLAELRAFQRRYRLAVALVHHLRKNAPKGQDGLSLRGSGDLYAWADSNLFLRRRERSLVLSAEHRAAPAMRPCVLELSQDPLPHLRVVDETCAALSPHAVQLEDRIIAALTEATEPLTRDALRHALQVRNVTLGDALLRLRDQGRIERGSRGFRPRAK